MPSLTVCQQTPVIVASQVINQTGGGDFSPITLFTPSADGVFRITVAIHSAFAGPSNGSVEWDYTVPETGSESGQLAFTPGVTFNIFSAVFESALGDAISLKSNNLSSFTHEYTVTVVLEQLA